MSKHLNSAESDNLFVMWIITALLVVIALPIWAASLDLSGRQPQDHTKPRPQGVSQLDGYNYLVSRGSPVKTNDICRPDGAQRTKRLSDGTKYIQCNTAQAWSQTGPVSPNFGRSLGWSVWQMAPWVGTLVLFELAFNGWVWERARRRTKREGRAAIEKAEKEKAEQTKLRERDLQYAEQYLKGDISDDDFLYRLHG